jgi:hypothetical protein
VSPEGSATKITTKWQAVSLGNSGAKFSSARGNDSGAAGMEAAVAGEARAKRRAAMSTRARARQSALRSEGTIHRLLRCLTG